MKITLKSALQFTLLTALAFAAGCGGPGSDYVNMTPYGSQSIDAGQTLSIAVDVSNDSDRNGATLSLNGPGTVSAPVSTGAEGTSTAQAFSYIAPASETAAQTAILTATAVDNSSATATLKLTINPQLAISTGTLPAGQVSAAYSQQLASTGGTGTVTWQLSTGTLPAGLALSSTGLLSGTPTAAGTYSFTIVAFDQSYVTTGTSQTYTVTIATNVPTVTTTSLPNAAVGVAYSQQLTYSGGVGSSVTWAYTGSLPAGLTLNPSTGVISGTPLAAAGGTVASFAVTVTVGTATSPAQTLSITTTALPTVTTTSLAGGNVGIAYSATLSYTGGTGGTPTWAITGAPSWLTLNTTTGALSGTPTTAGTFPFSVTVTVGTQTSAAQQLSITITNLAITSAAAITGEANLNFVFQFTAAGGTAPYKWSVASGALPSTLALASSGLLTGTPTTAATYSNIVIEVTDSLGDTATQTITLTISAARGPSLNAELKGQYAFLLSGFDASGAPYAQAGEFTADGNGNITSGLTDINGTALSAAETSLAFTGTYNIGSDGRGVMHATINSQAVVYTFAVGSLSSGVATAGFLSEFDAYGRQLTGTLALQTASAFTTASLTGGYAFGLSGFAGASTATSLTHRALAGEIQFNGTGSSTSAEYLTTAGTAVEVTPAATSIAVASTGRGTLSITSATGTLNFALYVVSASKFVLVSTGAASGSGAADLLSGTALAQTIANGNFSAGSLNGTTVLHLSRLNVTSTSGVYADDVLLGLASFNGAGTLSISADENKAGAAASDVLGGSYTVAADGRLTFTASSGLGGCLDCASLDSYGYLVGSNEAFVMDFTSGAGSGMLESYAAGTASDASLSGAYAVGTLQPVSASSVLLDGELTASGSGTVSGDDDLVEGVSLQPDVALAGTYVTAASGRTVVTPSPTDSVALYVVSATEAYSVDLDSAYPVVEQWLHQ